MRRLHTPSPATRVTVLERCGERELIRLFTAYSEKKPGRAEYELLATAWGCLFARVYLSAEELADEMGRGISRFSEEDDRMLRTFIRSDCAGGGSFVLEVIRNGGNLDRTALFLMTDLDGLTTIVQNGVMALQMLLEACDKSVRPALIKKAGKRLLSQVYDNRDLPLIFSIFGLCDVRGEDLDAIASIFTGNELRTIMSRSRTGNTALDVFRSVEASIRRYPSYERNASLIRNPFYLSAAKDVYGKKRAQSRGDGMKSGIRGKDTV